MVFVFPLLEAENRLLSQGRKKTELRHDKRRNFVSWILFQLKKRTSDDARSAGAENIAAISVPPLGHRQQQKRCFPLWQRVDNKLDSTPDNLIDDIFELESSNNDTRFNQFRQLVQTLKTTNQQHSELNQSTQFV